jgi:hypothetical protein
MAYIAALFFLVMATALAMALSDNAAQHMDHAVGSRQRYEAQLSAENGLMQVLCQLKGQTLPQLDDVPDDATQAVLTQLAQLLGLAVGTEPGDATINTEDRTLTLSPRLLNGHLSTAIFYLVQQDPSDPESKDILEVCVVGTADTEEQVVWYSYDLPRDEEQTTLIGPDIFEYGLVSNGTVVIEGGEVQISFNGDGDPMFIAGGDISVETKHPLGDDVTIEEVLPSEVAIPTVYVEQYRPIIDEIVETYADEDNVGLVISRANVNRLKKNSTYTHVLIKSGTTQLVIEKGNFEGLIYIESPNNVVFGDSVQINGLIVTENDPSMFDPDRDNKTYDGSQSTNKLHFTDSVHLNLLSSLNDLDSSEFDLIRDHVGTQLLAPSFDVYIANSVKLNSGVIAAERITMYDDARVNNTGPGKADIPTTLMNLGPYELNISGKVKLDINTIDGPVEMPAGFVEGDNEGSEGEVGDALDLIPIQGSYREGR